MNSNFKVVKPRLAQMNWSWPEQDPEETSKLLDWTKDFQELGAVSSQTSPGGLNEVT